MSSKLFETKIVKFFSHTWWEITQLIINLPLLPERILAELVGRLHCVACAVRCFQLLQRVTSRWRVIVSNDLHARGTVL